MRYYIRDKQLQAAAHEEDINNENGYVELITEDEFCERCEGLLTGSTFIRPYEKIRHCKAEVFEKTIYGALAIPGKSEDGTDSIRRHFYLDEKRLLFIGEQDPLNYIAERIIEEKSVEVETPAQALFAFLDILIREEGENIDNYEETLNAKESDMLEDGVMIPKDFDDYMQSARRELLNMNRYYEQLGDMAQILADAPGSAVDSKARRLFRFLAERADRLLDDARSLREYTSQVYDMYQSRINMRQNKVMQFLTVITTIFMPLTLITGWYGMNFKNMPELGWHYGYIGVVVLSAILFITEYIIFKKKKWM